ncbi:MAG: C45 family autoproteolytic acyltransferase/hydrolase [Chloroflexota bacterium]
MHQLTLRGTPAQMGAQHGALMAQVNVQLPPTNPQIMAFAEACEQLAVQHTPRLVAEMRAFAEAAQLSYDTLKSMMLAMPVQQNMPSCSVAAVMPERSADGKVMIGRNYDFTYGISWDAATMYTTYPAEGHAHIGNSDIWIGREDGLNDSGLFVALSATFLPGAQPGIPFWFIVRHLLENCTTVEEALAWITSIPHSQSRNYMLADPRKAVVVEASIEGLYVREPEDGILVMTNHPAHPALAAQKPFRPDDSPVRYDRLRTLSDDTVTLDSMQAALNDREHYVCAHGTVFGQPFGTIWSIIARPEDGHLAIAQGTGDNEGTMVYQDYAI